MKANEWHGRNGKEEWAQPVLAVYSAVPNRADQRNMTNSHEYLDIPEVLKEKVEMMVEMIKRSQHMCAYTGAGLSKSSGIPDYATKAKNSLVATAPVIKSVYDAQPTYSHCVLVAMEKAGYLHHWVQQNHDGLPQKAGFPQEKMNEIHGAWFDPSNPVVKFGGKLRGDLCFNMMQVEETTDLCLCLGTSLSGMNADRVARTVAGRSFRNEDYIGTIIINLQQTNMDDWSSLRIWAKLDDVFKMVAEQLGLGNIESHPFAKPPEGMWEIPYNKDGEYDPNCKMTLDLRIGSQVIIPLKGAVNFGAKGIVIEGSGDVDNCAYTIDLKENGRLVRRYLGAWWVHSLIQGNFEFLPVMNENPTIVEV